MGSRAIRSALPRSAPSGAKRSVMTATAGIPLRSASRASCRLHDEQLPQSPMPDTIASAALSSPSELGGAGPAGIRLPPPDELPHPEAAHEDVRHVIVEARGADLRCCRGDRRRRPTSSRKGRRQAHRLAAAVRTRVEHSQRHGHTSITVGDGQRLASRTRAGRSRLICPRARPPRSRADRPASEARCRRGPRPCAPPPPPCRRCANRAGSHARLRARTPACPSCSTRRPRDVGCCLGTTTA